MTAVKNKIPNVSDLVKETDCRAKILDIEFKYFTAADYNKFLSQTLNAKIKQEELVDKSAIAEFINNADSDNISSNISNESRIKSKAIQRFDSSYFPGKSHFEDDFTQNYLAFQPVYRYF